MSKPGSATGSNRHGVARRHRAALLLSGGVLALVIANPAMAQAVDALPTGGNVVAGSATIGAPSPTATLDITQSSSRAVIDWTSFDIGQNAQVTFTQPSTTAIALNRVVSGSAPSQIAGKLSANGIVAVLNANGVLFAGTADVNVGGLIASTGQVDTTAFMAGGNSLGITGANGGEILVSAGANISIANAGLAAFVAPGVRNSGTITATAGRVQLGAGTAFTLDLASDGLLQIGVGANSPLVQNLGSVFATGGQIQLSARQASALVDQTIRTGVLPVGSARLDGNTIVLDATGSDVSLTSNITGAGNLVLSGSRIYGAGDINVDGDLTLNVNAGGAVADTLATGNNWINDALGVIGAPVHATTINLGAGLYRSGTVINPSNVTLDGQGVARIGWVSGIENAIDVWGDNVTIKNLEIFGPATSAFTSYAWGSTNSRGVFVNRFADNVTVTNNNIHDIRTGVIVDGRNLGVAVTGNRIDNTKSAISIQYTNGSNVGLTGNFEGTFGNEWGINVFLNGILQPDGTTINPSTSSSSGLPVGVLGTANLTEQQRLMALKNANGGMSVQNIAYSAANRTRAYVSAGAPTNTQGSALNPLGTIQAGINAVVTGGAVNIANGTYNIGSTPISITKSLSLIGASQAGVIIDGRGVGAGLGTMQVQADNVSLSNFTLYGADNGASNYGIKVQPNSSGGAYSPSQRLLNFAISDVTVRGSTRAELDLNGVIGATITNFTADGRRVSNNAPTAGAGVQITDSANITLTGVHTRDNTWGSVALYQSNKPGAYTGQTTNINIDASQNTFDESIGLFSQLESTLQGFGQLNLTGFNYAVRNTDHRPDDLDGQFIFYRTSFDDAVNFAKGVGVASASSIEGYSGTALTNVFTVADGLSINSAIRDARSGGTINVGVGAFGETVSLGKALTLHGAGMDATSITGGLLLSGPLNNLVLTDFTVKGSGNGSSVIANTGTITGLTVSGVRIDGENVANRFGFIGGQIGGDIAITGSQFLNIRGWAAFDTRSGAGGNDGALITSGVFSNNLIDNTIGHIAFRQQFNALTLPDIVFAGNTLSNVGNATNSFGAMFKAFNAHQVDFTGNTVSGIGTSGFNPGGEAAYGAALMTRGTAVLNVVGNTFTGNNQVFAVEPGRGLPSVTNFTGNTFANNAYSIYLPGNLSGAGTITFGAGNNFIAGPNTVRHIVWRSASGLDLTGVAFDGTLAGSLNLAQAFAVEDLIFDGIDLASFGLARLANGKLFVTANSGPDAALRAVALGTNGDTLNLSAGTHTLSNTLFLTKDIDVIGQGKGVTILDASGHGSYGIRVHADNVTLGGFSLLGSSAATNASYGIKVESGGDLTERNTGFAINNVAISGSRKTGLDLNAVVGATIDGVDVTGVIAGNGISITDSANVTVRNSTTSGNAWGGLALYQSNNIAGGGSDQQLTNVTVTDNVFGESNGLYLQDSSALLDPGTLNLPGYAFTVRNATHRSDGAEFTFFRTGLQDALNFAVNLNPAESDSSVVQGWTGTANNREFAVGFGSLDGGGLKALSLQKAFDASSAGDSISVASGSYAQTATLNGARALAFGTTTLNGLTVTGSGTTLKGTLNTAGPLNLGTLALTGATTLTSGGALSLGGVSGDFALSLTGGAVTLGAANVASLAATGTTIATSGVTTTGSQTYTGATTLGGTYSASTFTVNGAATLGSATTVATTGNLTVGTVGGAQALTLSGTGVTLGTANVASLTATGTSISTSGATTTGAQAYTGATTLRGAYGASTLAVNGATTLGAATTVTTTGNLTLGAIEGAQALTLSGAGVTVGATSIASLAATGTSIATSGVTTTGAQAYTGATTLKGGYSASTFAVTGATTLGGTTTVAATGNLTLGTVGGAQALTLGGAGVTLGAANIGSLAATGTTIATSGVTTTGSQTYTGATTLGGTYSASTFTVNGAATLGSATTVTATGNLTVGTVGGAQALTLSGTGVTLGTANIASLTATGTSISTSGATTTGAQAYTGATTLRGAYGASTLAVNGATTLGAATTVTTTGNLTLGTVGGAQTLTLSGAGVTLGAANIASLVATGTSIATSGVTTTGAQSYVGATTLAGTYGASDFTVTGAAALAGTTNIAATGAASFGTIDGAAAFTLAATKATLGALGSTTHLGAAIVMAGETVLIGGTYRADSISFAGGSDTSVRLVGVETIFDTTSAHGDIAISPHLIGTDNGKQNVTFVTGTGVASDGDIALGNVGTNEVRIGNLSVAGGDFSAATVKLAGDFTSDLGGSQVFSSQTLDTLGNVKANVAGSESGPIVAGGSVSVAAGGSGTGSISAGGPVNLAYSNEVSRAITSQSSVSLNAAGPVTGSITATGAVGVSSSGQVSTTVKSGGSASISSTAGVSSAVTASGGVSLTSSQGAVSSQVSSGGTVNVNAAGPVSGSITATGPVAVSATGAVSTTVQTQNSANISSVAGVSSNVSAGGAVSLASSQGAVSSQVSSGGTVNVNAVGPVTGSITATGPVAVSATGPVSTTVQTQNSANISSVTGVTSNVTAGQGVQVTSSQGVVGGGDQCWRRRQHQCHRPGQRRCEHDGNSNNRLGDHRLQHG